MNALKEGVKHKKCAKCTVEFTCNDSGNSCWCNSHYLSQKKLDFLKDNYENCLCASCLKEFSKNK